MRTSKFFPGDLVLYKGKKWTVAGVCSLHVDWFGVSKERAIQLREEDERRPDKFTYILKPIDGTGMPTHNVPEHELSPAPEWDREEV